MVATKIELGNGESLAVADVRGTALAVNEGTLWITQQDDVRDVVLGPGDLWMVERDGLTIIEAQNDASFRAVGAAFERRMAARHQPTLKEIAARWLATIEKRAWVPYY